MFAASPCPPGWHSYGEIARGFCCDKEVSEDRKYCDGYTCAVDENQKKQGYPACKSIMDLCSGDSVPYGLFAGGFCCSSPRQLLPGGKTGYPSDCDGYSCALDPSRAQSKELCWIRRPGEWLCMHDVGNCY